MGLLGRRRRDSGNTEFEQEVRWGPTGWRPLPTPSVPQQIGVYGDAILNQYPAMWAAPMLRNGVGELNPGWIVLTASSTPYFQQDQQKADVPGAQRYGGKPGEQMGPLGARGLKAQVFAAQVQQSGLAAMSWAQTLKGWN